MTLKRYTEKRDLKKSPEPAAKKRKRKNGELAFVIQKHQARRLHYDLRLECDGVLKSWAVPKEPTTDPSIKRLAVMVEDHPYDYKDFEGIIPSGYGAGTVEIWDQGTYSVEGNSSLESEKLIREGLKKGSIHFTLEGNRLHGHFALVRMKKSEKEEWLLIKKDEKTKIDEDFLLPMLTTLVEEPFNSKEWLFEIKLDGFRAIADLTKSSPKLYSRNKNLFNESFPHLIEELKALDRDAVLDGEIVALDKEGISHFQSLQNWQRDSSAIYYYVFDLLYLDGKDLRHLPLVDRKNRLKKLIKGNSFVRYLDHVEDSGVKFFNACKKVGCEGIVGKKKQSFYNSGMRSKEWVKIKAEQEQEFVICGYTRPRKGRKHFGALIVGVYEKKNLVYAGHVGGGFSEKKLKEIKELLMPLETEKCPLKIKPKTNEAVTWVKPQYICEVKFKEWTDEGTLRMPIFIGLREDKPARAVKKEEKKRVEEL